tara:strand:- start:1136 stop:2383 length:1248 start_codon:yes stop_codon:yes gene_type:complete
MSFKIPNGFIRKIDNLQKKMVESGIIKNTPLELNERLSNKYNCNVYLKREDQQTVRSFKIRGAFSKITNLEKFSEIVCASAGNHAQGFAYLCNKLNIKGTIFVPDTTPLQKISRINYFSNGSCNLEINGNTFSEALKEALNYTENNNYTFVHPYDDIEVIEGQSTIASEIYKEINPDIIVSSIGGGGLISGLSLYSKMKNNCQIIGAEPYSCQSMKQSILKDEIIYIDTKNNFVDGATVNKVGNTTFEICKNYVDEIHGILDGETCENILDLYEKDGIIVEPAGALGLAALNHITNDIENKNVVVILSGGNNDVSRYPEIQEKFLKYKNLKNYYIVKFNQKPGQLKTFINNVLGKDDDIFRFEYIKKTNKEYGNVLIGIQTNNSKNYEIIDENLKKNLFEYTKIKENDLIYSYLI